MTDEAVSSYRLTQKNQRDRFEMNSTKITEFNDLLTALMSSPVLQLPKLNVPFILKVDCPQFYVGAVLVEENEFGQEHPVVNFPKKLLQQETKCSTAERECLSILLALKNFERYIFGVPVTIITHHNCVKLLLI